MYFLGGLLSYFESLFGSKEMRILILGLDGAGKTTILYRLVFLDCLRYNVIKYLSQSVFAFAGYKSVK